MGDRAGAGRCGARGGPARARDDRGRQRRPEARAGDSARVETAYLQLVMQRIWDEEIAAGLAAAAARDAPASRRRRHDRPGARRRRDGRHAGRGARRRSGGAALPRDLGRPEDRAELEGAREFTDAPGRAAGVGARATRARPHPAARSPRRRPAARSGGSCTTTCSRRRCSTGAVAERSPVERNGARPIAGRRARAPQPPSRRGGDRAGRGRSSGSACTCSILRGCSDWTSGPFDARLAVQDAPPPIPRVALIAVDDATLRASAGRRGPAPALATTRASSTGYAVTVRRSSALDVFFRTAGDPSADRALLRAIRNTGRQLGARTAPTELRDRTEADGDPTLRASVLGRTQPASVPHRLRRAARRPRRTRPPREPTSSTSRGRAVA